MLPHPIDPMRIFILFLATCLGASAIPNAIFGLIDRADSPLNGQDITEQLLAAALWGGDTALPGKWRDEAPVAAARHSHLLARPKVFGLPALMVQASHRDDILQSLSVTFADAGSYFGYYNEKLPEGLTQREAREELTRRLEEKQAVFDTAYAETLESLREALADRSERRPKDGSLGKTRALRAESSDYRVGDHVVRLLNGKGRLIRVIIVREAGLPRTWLDAELAALTSSDRLGMLKDNLARTEDGDVSIGDLPLVPQGYRPYCGLNTLAMAARYFGLHLDEDWLAVAGKFQNTGSAAGSQLLGLYLAVAKEAGFNMKRSNSFEASEARRSLQEGFPVIVWRRFSHQRNQFHTRHARAHARDSSLAIKVPSDEERQAWPGKDAPLHASVLVGFNDAKREFLFVESWTGLDFPRRMRAEELAATAYITFYFKP
jgi:hypothetical protein